MRARKRKAQIVISLLADFTEAHRWVTIIPEEHGMLACQMGEGKIWTNESETFGIASAACPRNHKTCARDIRQALDDEYAPPC